MAEEATITEATTRVAMVGATTAHTHKVEGTTLTAARNPEMQAASKHAVLPAPRLLAAAASATC